MAYKTNVIEVLNRGIGNFPKDEDGDDVDVDEVVVCIMTVSKKQANLQSVL